MSRQFSEDEARDIFARAAQRQHATEMRGEGLTLAELQEIGQAAGLDPEHVAAAVTEAGQRPVEPAVFTGVNVTPRASRLVPGDMSDPEWEQVVARLRQTFGSQGTATDVGRIREWTSGSAPVVRLTAEPSDEGTLVAVSSSWEREARELKQMPFFGAGGAALMFAFLLAGDFSVSNLWLIPGLILAVTLILALGLRQWFSTWSRTRQTQFDSLVDQIELIARDAAHPAPESGHLAPRGARLGFDLDDPGDTLPEVGRAGSRSRTPG